MVTCQSIDDERDVSGFIRIKPVLTVSKMLEFKPSETSIERVWVLFPLLSWSLIDHFRYNTQMIASLLNLALREFSHDQFKYH